MIRNALEIRGLTKSYKGFTLGPIDLTLPSGCILGLIGENGAGKSTTMRLILGMCAPDGGCARVFGTDVTDRTSDDAKWKADVGVVLDDPGLPPSMTAKQLSKMLRHIYPRWSDDAYRGYLDRLGVPTDKPFSALSRGTRMKLAIAIALSHGARLLLLDEATSGLDPLVRDEILTILMEFTRAEENAVLMSSHIVSDLEKACDYIALLHEGKLLLSDEKDRLLERFAVVRGSRETLSAIDPAAIRGRHDMRYGTELLAERALLPQGTEASPVNIEDLFLYLVRKEG